MHLFSVSDLVDMLYVFTHNKKDICPLWIADISSIPEAMMPDLSDMVSTNDMGQSSMFANYGDDSGDQYSLGKYLYTPFKWLSCAAE